MRKRFIALLALITGLMTAPAFAGPPLICKPIDIGTAASLPWNAQSGWNGMVASYDTGHLVADTLAVLSSAPPTTVLMETLRRAALYSTRDPRLADELARNLFGRRQWFEAGYFVEAVREAAVWRKSAMPPYIAAVVEGRIDPASSKQ
jgi:hypothetical protein